ncbi:Vanillate O-demethylase oxidoreductase VanB [Candidatus Sulfopaludibacter sp. SbA3]|nr:Vanillate O-demethylase oxidoreductase VanB [Candidatus Sulfopaludibacter sp. SbA3]
MQPTITDRIEKKIALKAPRQRVWEAITNENEFAKWFGVEFIEGKFALHQRAKLRATNKGYEHVQLYVTVERIEAPAVFAWRWIPGAEQPEGEATTLVEFRLEETGDGGTLLTVTESGFDRLSLAYRAKALQDNTRGWDAQAKSIQKYLETA